MTVRFHPEFLLDVADYARWFEERLPGLGDEFAGAVDVAIDQLIERPDSFRIMWKHYRRVLIRRFKVVIPFEVAGENTFVLGVVHGSRDLPRWIQRRS